MGTSTELTSAEQMQRRLHRYVPHEHLHFWAIVQGYDSLSDASLEEMVALANEVANPSKRDEWLAKFEPEPWEQMNPAENADPGDPSVLAHLFTAEQLSELNAAADRIQAASRARQ